MSNQQVTKLEPADRVLVMGWRGEVNRLQGKLRSLSKRVMSEEDQLGVLLGFSIQFKLSWNFLETSRNFLRLLGTYWTWKIENVNSKMPRPRARRSRRLKTKS